MSSNNTFSKIFNFFKENWWYVAFYGLLTSFLFVCYIREIKIDQNILWLLVLILLPLLLFRLSKIEFSGIKAELREIKNEVVETKREVRQEVLEVKETYKQISEKLSKMAERSKDFLKPQPLNISDDIAKEMRNSINLSDNLSDEDIEASLTSFNRDFRVPAYIQLQIDPRSKFLSMLIDCLWIEQFEARRNKETRPMWQLLVALGSYKNQLTKSEEEHERKRLKMMFEHTLLFLQSEKDGERIDPNDEVKDRIDELLNDPEYKIV